LLWSAPPASADRDWDDDDYRGRRHQRYDDRHGGRHHQHGDWCAPRRHGHKHKHKQKHEHGYYAAPRYAGWEGGWYGPRPVAHARYRCEPCGRWYDEEAAFHQHLHRQHSIARAVLPLVIGAAAFGWIFYGH
jgi:hypothetical protein